MTVDAQDSELNDEGMEEARAEDLMPTEAAAALEREMPGQLVNAEKAGHRGCRLPHISFQERKGLPAIRAAQLDELAKLHDDMAHAPPLALARHLRLAGVAAEAVAYRRSGSRATSAIASSRRACTTWPRPTDHGDSTR